MAPRANRAPEGFQQTATLIPISEGLRHLRHYSHTDNPPDESYWMEAVQDWREQGYRLRPHGESPERPDLEPIATEYTGVVNPVTREEMFFELNRSYF